MAKLATDRYGGRWVRAVGQAKLTTRNRIINNSLPIGVTVKLARQSVRRTHAGINGKLQPITSA